MNENIKYTKNQYIYNICNRKKYIQESFEKNYVFWITYLCIILFLSLRYGSECNYICRIISGFTSTIFAMVFGWWIHMMSHKTSFSKLYDDLEINLPSYIDNIIRNINTYILDFHDTIHHNSDLNDNWYNILIEAIENILMEGGFIIIISILLELQLNIRKHTFTFNHTLIIFWGILYTSVHLINYKWITPNPHNDHHKNVHTNYGIDTLDILFNTKYDMNDIELFNHGTINLIIIFVLLIFIKESKYF